MNQLTILSQKILDSGISLICWVLFIVWEIRGSKTKVRGKVSLIESGTGTIVGTAERVDGVGPLSVAEMKKTRDKHLVSPSTLAQGLPYKTTYAWVLKNARRLKRPKSYKHPRGAIIWVNLS